MLFSFIFKVHVIFIFDLPKVGLDTFLQEKIFEIDYQCIFFTKIVYTFTRKKIETAF